MNNFALDVLATPQYRATLQERYKRPGWGGSGYHHWIATATFARELGATSVLDYGCGRGKLRESLLEFSHLKDIHEYDPGIVGKDALPSPADLVVATDVLEHIEPDLLSNVLYHFKHLARKGIYLVIATDKAKEVLPDGRNAHLIQRPGVWWIQQLRQHGLFPCKVEQLKGVHVWIRI